MTAAQHSPKDQPLVLSIADFDFTANSTAVVSEACKFVIPVPDLGEAAEPLVYPSDHPKAGEPIVDYKGEKVGKRGLVFFNEKDQAYQAVPADGSGVIIINEVLPEQAHKIDEKVRSLTQDPVTLTSAQIRTVLDYCHTELGLKDTYNSDKTYVREHLTDVSDNPTGNPTDNPPKDYGLKKRDKTDVCQAVYVPGEFRLEGPATSVQIFSQGGVVIESHGNTRGIQPDIFLRTYQLENGQPITDIKRQIARQGLN
ncbi:MAG: hypothetical protein AAFP03_13135 [Cyanobacteria bacterium J06598_3]